MKYIKAIIFSIIASSSHANTENEDFGVYLQFTEIGYTLEFMDYYQRYQCGFLYKTPEQLNEIYEALIVVHGLRSDFVDWIVRNGRFLFLSDFALGGFQRKAEICNRIVKNLDNRFYDGIFLFSGNNMNLELLRREEDITYESEQQNMARRLVMDYFNDRKPFYK